MSTLPRTMRPTADEVDSSPLRAASWKRPKIQSSEKAQLDEKRGTQNEVRRVIGEASDGSAEIIEQQQEQSSPASPKSRSSARLKVSLLLLARKSQWTL